MAYSPFLFQSAFQSSGIDHLSKSFIFIPGLPIQLWKFRSRLWWSSSSPKCAYSSSSGFQSRLLSLRSASFPSSEERLSLQSFFFNGDSCSIGSLACDLPISVCRIPTHLRLSNVGLVGIGFHVGNCQTLSLFLLRDCLYGSVTPMGKPSVWFDLLCDEEEIWPFDFFSGASDRISRLRFDGNRSEHRVGYWLRFFKKYFSFDGLMITQQPLIVNTFLQ